MKDYLQYTERVGECLEWIRCFNTDGYPRALVDGNCNGKVHREVFYQVNGYYPEVVRHSCDNIKCINPSHLLGGSALDNIQDRSVRKRTHNHINQSEIDCVFKLRKQGYTYKEIADHLDCKMKRVEYILARKES